MPPIPLWKVPESAVDSQPDHALIKYVAVGVEADRVAIYGYSLNNAGVYGASPNNVGVVATSDQGTGVYSTSASYEAVHAETNSPTTATIAAYNLNPEGTGAALYAKKLGGFGHAGFFDGKVYATDDVWTDGNHILTKGSIKIEKGDILLTSASDCAEDFDVAPSSEAEPGTVMILSGENCLSESTEPYDTRVAGVISGAGTYKPGIVLDRKPGPNRHPVALLGKVYCKVDAGYGAVAPGDLLTTSPTKGHAMKVQDSLRGIGAVLGKAMASLTGGCGLIPVLVTLR
jgi:hypothetical protein